VKAGQQAEIAALVAKAQGYVASIPAGDVRLKAVVPTINMLCEGIMTALAFINLPGSARLGKVVAAEWEGRIDTSLAQLGEWLVRGQAFELAQEIGRRNASRLEASSKGADARRKQAAARWPRAEFIAMAKLMRARHPEHSGLRIANAVRWQLEQAMEKAIRVENPALTEKQIEARVKAAFPGTDPTLRKLVPPPLRRKK
jgi:hypothetical protein